MSGWQQPTSGYYRELEREQLALAEIASCAATRDIHLEFADRYKQQAERLEVTEQGGGIPDSETKQD